MPGFRRRYNYLSRNNKRQRVSYFSRARVRLGRRRGLHKKKVTSGKGFTKNYDRGMIYRKKTMPRRIRRRWRKFMHKVKRVDEYDLGTRTVVFNKTYQQGNQTSTDQGRINLCLYGWDSNDANQTWHNDLGYMAKLENSGNPTAANGETVDGHSQILFTSAVLDLTIRNTSIITVGGAAATDTSLELDVYEWTARKEAEIDGSNDQTGTSMFDRAEVVPKGIYNGNTAAVGTPVDISKRGGTPFDCGSAISVHGIKIWKKTKYFLPWGATMTYQIRDPKRHTVNRKDILQTSSGSGGCNKPGMTRHLLIIFKAVPGITVGDQSGNSREQIDIGITRKYQYRIEGVKEDRSIKIVG